MALKEEWENRIVAHGSKPADQFQANPLNWRVHPQIQREAVKGSLQEVGWVDEVIENVVTGHLIDGHERVWNALQNGNAEVPFVQVELTEEEEEYVLATLDPIGAMAEGDQAVIDDLLQDVETGNQGIQAVLDDLAGEPMDYQRDDRTLEEIDLEQLPQKPIWVLCCVPVEDLPMVKPLLDQIEEYGIEVELSDA